MLREERLLICCMSVCVLALWFSIHSSLLNSRILILFTIDSIFHPLLHPLRVRQRYAIFTSKHSSMCFLKTKDFLTQLPQPGNLYITFFSNLKASSIRVFVLDTVVNFIPKDNQDSVLCSVVATNPTNLLLYFVIQTYLYVHLFYVYRPVSLTVHQSEFG